MSLIMKHYPVTRMKNTRRSFAMPVDVVEMDDAFMVQANLPGFEKDEISIELDFETLKIIAEKVVVEKDEKEEVKYLHRERFARKMARTMKFHKPVDASKASSSYKNGVLSITIPFAEIAKTVKLVPQTN